MTTVAAIRMSIGATRRADRTGRWDDMGFPFQCDAPSVELGAGKDTSQAWSAVPTGSAVRRVSEQECIAMACIPPGRQPCTLPGTGRQTHAQIVGRASSSGRSSGAPACRRSGAQNCTGHVSDRQTGPSALFVVPMRRGRAASSPEASTLAMNKPVGGVGGARSALKAPKKSNGPPPLDRAAGAGPTNTEEVGRRVRVWSPGRAELRSDQEWQSPGRQIADIPSGSQLQDAQVEQVVAARRDCSMGNQRQPVPAWIHQRGAGYHFSRQQHQFSRSYLLFASFRATASTRKMRERTGGPACEFPR